MKYRPLGDSGLEVSEIGFGAWGIGGRTNGLTSYGETDDQTSSLALQRAVELGITFFDTSGVYGYGRSERLIGKALAHCRDRVVIATKTGFTTYDQAPDYSPGQIRRSLDDSLERLGTGYVDLLQLHNPPPDLLAARPDIAATLDALKHEGLIRAHGVSVKSPEDGISILGKFAFNAIQINLNMMDLRALESGLLDQAVKAGVGIVARTPLCFGFLSGDVTLETEFPEGDHRRLWSREQLRRWCDGAKLLRGAVPVPEGQNQAHIALRFCLSHAGVSSVIPGILTPEQAEENALASEFGPLAPEHLRAIDTINSGEDFFVPPSEVDVEDNG